MNLKRTRKIIYILYAYKALRASATCADKTV